MNETPPLNPFDSADPYWKLRPAGPTPDDELCRCASIGAILLRDSLSENPLYCLSCNGEVAPERIGFDAQLAEDIARWRDVHHALETLWLDSGEYEQWAALRLADVNGAVNVKGRAIAMRLNRRVRTYYWWFTDHSDVQYEPPSDCPICCGVLAQSARKGVLLCSQCHIALW